MDSGGVWAFASNWRGQRKDGPLLHGMYFHAYIALELLQLTLLIHRLTLLTMLAGACLPRAFCQHAGKKLSDESHLANEAM